MYSPVHATAGLLIAKITPDPVSGFLLAVVSHYLLDMIPHGDSHLGDWMKGHPQLRMTLVEIVDLGLTAVVVSLWISLFSQTFDVQLLLGAIGGIAPDLLWGGTFVLERLGLMRGPFGWLLHQHNRWHAWIHVRPQHDVKLIPGMVAQAIVLGLVLFLFQR